MPKGQRSSLIRERPGNIWRRGAGWRRSPYGDCGKTDDPQDESRRDRTVPLRRDGRRTGRAIDAIRAANLKFQI